MSNRNRPRELRLEIGHEADALVSDLGIEAYWVALQRAQEASSDVIARDWSGVARAIARKTGQRPASLFSMMLQ